MTRQTLSNRLLMTCRLIIPLGLLLILAACEQSLSLKVESDIPVPALDRMPVRVGVFYSEPLRNHVYAEDTKERPGWKIESGASHLTMFRQVLPAMFSEVQELTTLEPTETLDAVLAPELADLQFALPGETGTDFYEAWVKYDMVLYDPAGDSIAGWSVTGYGKSSTEFMKSRSNGLNAAVNQALRDAGARLALGFPKVAEVNAWLAQRDGAPDLPQP